MAARPLLTAIEAFGSTLDTSVDAAPSAPTVLQMLQAARNRAQGAMRPRGETGVNAVIDYLRRRRMRRTQADGRR